MEFVGANPEWEVRQISKELLDMPPPATSAQPGASDSGNEWELFRQSNGMTVNNSQGQPITFAATDLEDAESKIERIARDFNLGAPQLFGVRGVLQVPNQQTTDPNMRTWRVYARNAPSRTAFTFHSTSQHALQIFKIEFRRSGLAAVYDIDDFDYELVTGTTQQEVPPPPPEAQPTTPGQTSPSWEIYDVNTGVGVHRFDADSERFSINGLALSWLRNNNYPNPMFNYRVRPANGPGSQWSREQSDVGRWEIYNHNDENTVVSSVAGTASEVQAILPTLEDRLHLPRGSLRVRYVQ
jgi:hypothetical protein